MKSRLLLTLAVITLLFFPKNVVFGQAPDLGTAGNFSLFTVTGAVGNTGTSSIQSKIGTGAGAITAFSNPPEDLENGNAVTDLASTDLQSAYDEIYNTPATFPPHDPVLGNGETLIPGVYSILSAGSLEGILTLDAQGNPDAIFIFKIQGAFSPGPSSKILLSRGASACNIFWAVQGGEVAIATLSEMKGNFIANPGAVSMAASSKLEGRALSTTGAIAIDQGTVSVPLCTVLPVTLINFKAIRENKSIKLLWTVADEVSLERYQLDRSADGRNFYSIGSVYATNATFLKTYTWVDDNPLDKVNLYRLKIIDIDGAFKYSVIVKIDMDVKKEVLFYPSPVTGHILQMYIQEKGDYTINLYNNNGQKVMSTTLRHDGNPAVRSIALNKNLPGGVYYLELHCAGNNKKTTKIQIR